MNVLSSPATTITSESGEICVNASQNPDVTISRSGLVFYKRNHAIDTHKHFRKKERIKEEEIIYFKKLSA
ncbi:MAG: hypothetical protein M3015_08460 [Bacteroidota bacterium]|nr:hypothetical protein [Bacteroidota bacterium]